MIVGYDAGPGTFKVRWSKDHGPNIRTFPPVSHDSVAVREDGEEWMAEFTHVLEWNYKIWVEAWSDAHKGWFKVEGDLHICPMREKK